MSHLAEKDGLTSSTGQTPTSPFVLSHGSPGHNQAAPHPILNSTLIPRDYLGSVARPPRSDSRGVILGNKTSPSSSKPQSPIAPSFSPRQQHSGSNQAREASNSSAVDQIKTVEGGAGIRSPDLNVNRTRPAAVPSPPVNGQHRSSPTVPTNLTFKADPSVQSAMPRTSSIDSAISSISSTNVSGPTKSTGEKEPTITEIRNLIATAGSAENLVQHLLRDKAQAAAQNAQLWKLVDKQRALLLGLNKDLERAAHDRDRYRKRAKELAAAQTEKERHVSGSHSPPRTPPTDELPIQMTESREVHQEPDPGSRHAGQDETSPVEDNMMPPPLHFNLQQQQQQQRARASEQPKLSALSTTELAAPSFAVIAPTPVTSSPSQSFSTKRQIAPKPLDLRSSKEDSKLAQLALVDAAATESVADTPPDHQRGRRKTREEDDRDREMTALQQAMQQEEARSRSKKTSKQPQPPMEPPAKLLPAADITQSRPVAGQSQHQTTASDASSQYSQKGQEGSTLSPPMRSPGLPASPRPSAAERAIVSPESHSSLNSLPLSPRNGGFPLSPRAPKQPIPMPSNLQSAQLSSLHAPDVTLPPRSESLNVAVNDGPMVSSSDIPTPYRGLVVATLPDLLLPPNALPSIQVKVASSRLKPSRFSMLGLKPQEDTSVFSLSIFSRSNYRELWRIEKIPAALPHLDQQIRPRCPEVPRLPDRKLFTGHAPATLDHRRNAIDQYFDDLLDTHIDEQSALLICKFLSTDVLEPQSDAVASKSLENIKQKTHVGQKKTGYLTKKGKNFGGWKSRYFVLESPELRYFEAPGGAHLGTIKLANARIGRQTSNEVALADEAESETQYRHAFLILEPKRKDSSSYVRHVLCAENDTERDEWVTALLHHIEESQAVRPPTSGGDGAHPRTLLRGADYADGQADAAAKSSSPTLGPGTSGSASPTSSATPPLDQGTNEPYAKPSSASLGIPTNPRAGNRQSSSGQPQGQKIRNLFQFRKSSHEALNGSLGDQRSPHPPASTRSAHRGYVRPVFGLSLVEAVESCPPEGVDVLLPAVAYRCIQYLRGKKAANEEGLFRLSGSNIVIRTLKERFNTEGDVDLLEDEEYYDVHAVASLFKSYLRELPTTLLTRELHLEFLKVLELDDKRQKIVAFNALVHRLPRVNFVLLRALSEYLLEVVSNQDRNKMTVKNVGIVFSPTLNIPAPVFSMFLTEFHAIFDQPEQDEIAQPFVTIHEPQQDDIRSPRRQMFTDLPTPQYNQNSFAQNASAHTTRGYDHAHHIGDMGMQPLQHSYETRSYVSNPNDHPPAPPQPMYPPPPQPGQQQQYQQQQQGGYRVVAPDNAASSKQKRRESAMLLF